MTLGLCAKSEQPVIVKCLTHHSRVWDMASAKCRNCERAAEASAYYSSCAAAIMPKALNPFFGGKCKKTGDR